MSFLLKKIFLLLLLGFLINPCLAAMRGFRCSKPVNFFEGVGIRGNVEIYEKLGDLHLYDGVYFPLFIIFDSQENSVSTHLGKGWRFPFFESTAIPQNEKNFRVAMPDGQILIFRQSNKDKDKFVASSVWSALRKKNLFLVKSIDGIELTYKEGRLQKMVQDGNNIQFEYKDGKISEINNGLSTLLESSIIKDEIVLKGKHLNTVFSLKLEEIKEKEHSLEVPSGKIVDKSKKERKLKALSSIKLKNQEVLQYAYENPSPMVSILKIKNILNNTEKKFSWNTQNGIIKTGDDYKYTVTFPGYSKYAAIERIGGAYNQREYWYRDTWGGRETTLRADGVTVVQSWFTSGKLKGLTRSIISSINKDSSSQEYSYDENARLVRTLVNGKETFLIYDSDGTLSALVVDGELVKEYTNNAQNLAKEFLK